MNTNNNPYNHRVSLETLKGLNFNQLLDHVEWAEKSLAQATYPRAIETRRNYLAMASQELLGRGTPSWQLGGYNSLEEMQRINRT